MIQNLLGSMTAKASSLVGSSLSSLQSNPLMQGAAGLGSAAAQSYATVAKQVRYRSGWEGVAPWRPSVCPPAEGRWSPGLAARPAPALGHVLPTPTLAPPCASPTLPAAARGAGERL